MRESRAVRGPLWFAAPAADPGHRHHGGPGSRARCGGAVHGGSGRGGRPCGHARRIGERPGRAGLLPACTGGGHRCRTGVAAPGACRHRRYRRQPVRYRLRRCRLRAAYLRGGKGPHGAGRSHGLCAPFRALHAEHRLPFSTAIDCATLQQKVAAYLQQAVPGATLTPLSQVEPLLVDPDTAPVRACATYRAAWPRCRPGDHGRWHLCAPFSRGYQLRCRGSDTVPASFLGGWHARGGRGGARVAELKQALVALHRQAIGLLMDGDLA